MSDRPGPVLPSMGALASGLLRYGHEMAAAGIAELVGEATVERQKQVGLESGGPARKAGAARGGTGAGAGGIAMRDGDCLGIRERVAAHEPLTEAETAHLTGCARCARLEHRRAVLVEAFTFAFADAPGATARDSGSGAEARSIGRTLLGGVEALPPVQRMAILLRYGHELDIPEIAGLLGVGRGTVRALLVWGLEGLLNDVVPGIKMGARPGTGAEVL